MIGIIDKQGQTAISSINNNSINKVGNVATDKAAMIETIRPTEIPYFQPVQAKK